ncbi:transmembrane protein [Arabidopsis thaliana]|uniref:Transmembrane protein n=1 Tax=Arabidopsis thaliana TaxID=3702 RepID=F4IIC7_ARATH|nr:uncharacterized protein AT2G06095 [Arabidopsis thaliana]AEC06002.1 transmembrane protein [Arabidopsis thaliana]|eukprot:NP_671785.1 transmembrane protein [Arabidopsis thaliana]
MARTKNTCVPTPAEVVSQTINDEVVVASAAEVDSEATNSISNDDRADFESLCCFSSLFSVFSGILYSGTIMEMRRHFGAKAKEKKAKDDFGLKNQEECRSTHSWCRSTPVSAQQSP